MKHLHRVDVLGAESADDAVRSTAQLEAQLTSIDEKLASVTAEAERIRLLIDRGYILTDLGRKDESHQAGHLAFELALSLESWEPAVEACDIIYMAEQEDAVKALAHGIWLGVTYPIDPELSVSMLENLINETPPKADGAAVAAAVARYLVDLRAEGRKREDLQFFTGQMMGDVARRHSQVDEQEVFDFWVERLELDDPGKFLPRLATVLDVMVDDEWWYDRDALRDKIPSE